MYDLRVIGKINCDDGTYSISSKICRLSLITPAFVIDKCITGLNCKIFLDTQDANVDQVGNIGFHLRDSLNFMQSVNSEYCILQPTEAHIKHLRLLQ